MHKKGADGNPSDHVWTAILGWLDIFLSVKQSIDQQDLQANFPSQMCFVININNQVIEWLIIQKQHLLAVLLSRNTPPPGPMVITETGLVHCCYSLTLTSNTQTHTHKQTHRAKVLDQCESAVERQHVRPEQQIWSHLTVLPTRY